MAPRTALAVAGDRRHAGRSGTDLLVALAVLVIATGLHGLVLAVWMGTAVDPMLGVRALVSVLTLTLTRDLALLVIGALALFVVSRKDIGRAFDLACVAMIPIVAFELAAHLVMRAVGLPMVAMWAVSALGFGWMGVVIALAIPQARRPSRPGAIHPRAKLAGAVIAALVVANLGIEGALIARDPDSVRPLMQGSPAPALALPQIGAHGELGDRVAVMPGQITIVDFWATWCGPCLQAMPALDAFAKRHPEVRVLAVNLDDAVAARKLFDIRGYTLTLVADDGETSARYNVSTIPHTVVIDRDGVVKRVFRGGGGDLEAAVR